MAAAVSQLYLPHPHSVYSQSQNMATLSTQLPHDQDILEDHFVALFCRALYDYDAQDASALSFRRGDIIEVLTKQPSGWWDGLLGDERGWFPSNYVEVISDEEAELAFAAMEFMGPEGTGSQSHSAMMQGMNARETEEWSGDESAYDNANRMSRAPSNNSTSSDFWMPQVTPDGQIYYVNTQTGQRSRDLPQEADDEISDSDFAGLASQSSSRSGTSVGLTFGLKDSSELSSDMQDIAGFGIPRRTGTPEPWARKLADDGRTYYYYNKIDGTIQWTRPEDSGGETSLPPVEKSYSLSSQSSSSTSLSRPPPGSNRHSVYSDDSDVQPHEHLRLPQDGEVTFASRRGQRLPSRNAQAIDHTSAEKIARVLQKALAPPSPELITELSTVVKSAIQAVVDDIKRNGPTRRPEEENQMDELVDAVVLAVRNLLYVSAVSTGQIAEEVLPHEARDGPASSQSPLKPAQRKVTATLSRLVLSARAIQYDAGALIADTLHRIEVDAEELEKAVFAFVLDVQRTHGTLLEKKRLHGVFETFNIGLGLVGAGTAGHWKGFGWVPVRDPETSSRRVLGPEAISRLKSDLTALGEQSQALGRILQAPDETPEQVQTLVRELVAQVSGILVSVSDIHIARHVDIDGYREEGGPSGELYCRAVENARQFVRTLEAIVQSVFDDCATLFLTLQLVRDFEPVYIQERRQHYDYVDALYSSITSNLTLLLHTLDNLLSLGHDQAEMAQGDYNGSIEWRMSLVSVRPISQFTAIDAQNAEVVDIEHAFGRQGVKSGVQEHEHLNGSEASHTIGEHDLDSAGGTLLAEERSEQLSSDPLIEADRVTLSEDDPILSPKSRGQGKVGKGKLEKILGDEYADKVAADLKPWYLRTTHDPQEILIDNDGSVRGGTVGALVERLTAHDQTDRTFINAFLMTFKSFTTPDEFFDLLVARFRIQPPPKLNPTEREEWGKLKQHVIQMRVINTLKSMITDEDVLEKEDYYILDRIRAFATSEEMGSFAAAKILVSHIDRVKGGDNPKMSSSQAPPPPPILPKTNKKLRLSDIEPLELARQLTIMESLLYQKIKPMECLQRAREQKLENMDNIATVIQTSNRIADWVADLVLGKEDPRRRAAIVKQLITIADRCRSMNNFSTMIAITSGLNTPPIRRLKRTWEQVNQRALAQFTACELTIDSNKTFTKYRQLMSSVTPPCVPFIGVFLSTLQFIQDGNPDNLPGNLVNFRKRQKAFEVINDIKQWQAHPYNLQPVPAIQTFIEESLNRFNDTRASSEHFWALSLAREPREREDEKMARLLQESGFL